MEKNRTEPRRRGKMLRNWKGCILEMKSPPFKTGGWRRRSKTSPTTIRRTPGRGNASRLLPRRRTSSAAAETDGRTRGCGGEGPGPPEDPADFRADGGSASARDRAAAVGDAAIPRHLPGILRHVKLLSICRLKMKQIEQNDLCSISGINDHINLFIKNSIDDMRSTFKNFIDSLNFDICSF